MEAIHVVCFLSGAGAIIALVALAIGVVVGLCLLSRMIESKIHANRTATKEAYDAYLKRKVVVEKVNEVVGFILGVLMVAVMTIALLVGFWLAANSLGCWFWGHNG